MDSDSNPMDIATERSSDVKILRGDKLLTLGSSPLATKANLVLDGADGADGASDGLPITPLRWGS